MQKAYIREEECVGCTACLSACPVDAIIGSLSFMHSVIVDECIGCQLCIAPCPVDCIELIESSSSTSKEQMAANAKIRIHARKERLQHEVKTLEQINKAVHHKEKQSHVAAALQRAKAKYESNDYQQIIHPITTSEPKSKD